MTPGGLPFPTVRVRQSEVLLVAGLSRGLVDLALFAAANECLARADLARDAATARDEVEAAAALASRIEAPRDPPLRRWLRRAVADLTTVELGP